jgi:hypothetical protein
LAGIDAVVVTAVVAVAVEVEPVFADELDALLLLEPPQAERPTAAVAASAARATRGRRRIRGVRTSGIGVSNVGRQH